MGKPLFSFDINLHVQTQLVKYCPWLYQKGIQFGYYNVKAYVLRSIYIFKIKLRFQSFFMSKTM